MTVAELIKELKKFDQDKRISFTGLVRDYFCNHRVIFYGYEKVSDDSDTVWIELGQDELG